MLDQFRANGLVKLLPEGPMREIQRVLSLSDPIEVGTGTQIPHLAKNGNQVYEWPGTGELGTIKNTRFLPLNGGSPRTVKPMPDSSDCFMSANNGYVLPAQPLNEYSCAFRSLIFGMRWLEGQPIDSTNLNKPQTPESSDANFGTVLFPDEKRYGVNDLRRRDAELLNDAVTQKMVLDDYLLVADMKTNIPQFWDLSLGDRGKPHATMVDVDTAQCASARVLGRPIVLLRLEAGSITIFPTQGTSFRRQFALPIATKEEWRKRNETLKNRQINAARNAYTGDKAGKNDNFFLNWAKIEASYIFAPNCFEEFEKCGGKTYIESTSYENYLENWKPTVQQHAAEHIEDIKNELLNVEKASIRPALFLMHSTNGKHFVPLLRLSNGVTRK
ncbi:MAG: hypothetical protein LBT98_01605 [Puniceicoccales bacterium]|nr:hypothetical protein [Puniceicoccales bacterium]